MRHEFVVEDVGPECEAACLAVPRTQVHRLENGRVQVIFESQQQIKHYHIHLLRKYRAHIGLPLCLPVLVDADEISIVPTLSQYSSLVLSLLNVYVNNDGCRMAERVYNDSLDMIREAWESGLSTGTCTVQCYEHYLEAHRCGTCDGDDHYCEPETWWTMGRCGYVPLPRLSKSGREVLR